MYSFLNNYLRFESKKLSFRFLALNDLSQNFYLQKHFALLALLCCDSCPNRNFSFVVGQISSDQIYDSLPNSDIRPNSSCLTFGSFSFGSNFCVFGKLVNFLQKNKCRGQPAFLLIHFRHFLVSVVSCFCIIFSHFIQLLCYLRECLFK